MLSKEKSFIDLGFAKLDYLREKRRGLPEIIFAPGKDLQQLKKIVTNLKGKNTLIILSRLEEKKYKFLKKTFPQLKYFKKAQIGFLGRPLPKTREKISVVTGGTSDIPIAEESAVFLELLGNKVERIYDVGVAGFHRLLPFQNKLNSSKVIIVSAGMEAALASLVSALTKRPVIGLPTSIGYGSHFEGLASLLGMLNSCSPGIGVVNIDNGIGAGYLAHIIANNE